MPNKQLDEDEASAGRYIGVIAREDQALYEALKEAARVRKVKISDVFREALELWYLAKNLEGMDSKCLVGALIFLNNVMEQVIKMMTFSSSFFVSQYFRDTSALVHELAQELAAKKQQEEEEKKAAPPAPEFSDMLKVAMMPVVFQIVQQVIKGITGKDIQLPLPGVAPTPTASTQNIQVVEEEEKKEEKKEEQKAE